jgi:putative heme-binding domain-containing protein
LVQLAVTTDPNITTAVLTAAPRHAKAMLARLDSLPPGSRARALKAPLQKLVTSPIALATIRPFAERTNIISTAQRAERIRILAAYKDVEKFKGDAAKGAVLFKQLCVSCHRFKGEGIEVGPDMGTMAGKPVEAFVTAIIDPNAAMEARYQNYTATLIDGREVSGIIVAETVTSLTLRSATGHDETLLRTDIKELTASGLSLMPENLEQALPSQAMADLISYLFAP